MTFQDTFAVDGSRISGQLLRLQLWGATMGGEGIVHPWDLEVRELEVPGTSVRILDGGCVMEGTEYTAQGSYESYNVGTETLPIAATDSSGPRSDLVCVRVEDPTWAGSPWPHDPATERISWPRVIPNVDPGLTYLHTDYTGIVLARIDIPSSTATITQDMIKDLRFPLIRNPMFQDSIQYSGARQNIGNQATFDTLPQSTTRVEVPNWSNVMDINCTVRTIGFDNNTDTAGENNNMWGNTRFTVNGTAEGQTSAYNYEWPAGVSHSILGHAATLNAIPHRGTAIDLAFQLNVFKNGDEFMYVHEGTSIIWQVFFRQTPEFNF